MLLAMLIYWQGLARAQPARPVGPITPTELPEDDFPQRIAGSYLMSFRFPPDFDDPTTGQVTIHADGTYTAFPEAAFGRLNPPDTRFRSAWHGCWERIGPRTIKMRGYIYGHDGSYDPDHAEDPLWRFGQTTWIARQDPVAEFDEDFERFTGEISTEMFLREQLFLPDPEPPEGGLIPNPNTEDSPVYGTFPGTWIGVRIHPDV
jgi:hypothetical protein